MLADSELNNAVNTLRVGGVIAYPTEYCFGLGCDPRNEHAVEKLLKIKRRDKAQGVILIAADLSQIEAYADLSSLAKRKEILASWPGANTWLLPAHKTVSSWIRGEHTTIAMRIPDHALCRELCRRFGHPIVSTSANRHGQPAHTSAPNLIADLGNEVDLVVEAPLGGATSPSTIRDAITGEILR